MPSCSLYLWSAVQGSSFQTTSYYNYFKTGGHDVGQSCVVLEGSDSHGQTSGDVTPLGERDRNAEAELALGAVGRPRIGAWTLQRQGRDSAFGD